MYATTTTRGNFGGESAWCSVRQTRQKAPRQFPRNREAMGVRKVNDKRGFETAEPHGKHVLQAVSGV